MATFIGLCTMKRGNSSMSLILRYKFFPRSRVYVRRSLCITASVGQCNSTVENDFYGLKENLEKSYSSVQGKQTPLCIERNTTTEKLKNVLEHIDPKSFEIQDDLGDYSQKLPFGFIRYDNEQKEKEAGQGVKKARKKRKESSTQAEDVEDIRLSTLTVEKDVLKLDKVDESKISMEDKARSEFGYIDEQFFQHDFQSDNEQNIFATDQNESSKLYSVDKTELPFIDEQYFEYNLPKSQESIISRDEKSSFNKSVHVPLLSDHEDTNVDMKHSNKNLDENIDKKAGSKVSFIDEQYFAHSPHLEVHSNKEICENDVKIRNLFSSTNNQKTDVSDSLFEKVKASLSPEKTIKKKVDIRKEFIDINEDKADFTDRMFHEAKDVSQIRAVVNKFKRNKNKTYEGKAFDVVKDLRAQNTSAPILGQVKITLDCKGFRILKSQVPQFEFASSLEIVNLLRKSILYNEKGIVAINKPYGLPSHGGPGVKCSVGQLLADIIPSSKLHLIHRLDKETTGVLLLAKSQDTASRLHNAFLQKEVKKRYLTITKGFPNTPKGLIDIPIAEGIVEDKYRMTLRPYRSPELNPLIKSTQKGKDAQTVYRVLDSKNMTSLIECIAITGLKHQIRVHLAQGLNCPVLGDHKYAHLNKMAPMQLHPDTLERLQIQQTKVRYLPMHLHARSLMIPEYFDGKPFFVSAPLPYFFIQNMRSLKLKLPAKMFT